jgi:hypothetical protein
MNNDGVSIAFELITDELQRVADGLADQGAKSFKERRYDDAQSLIDTGKNLQEFIGKVNALVEEWQAGIDVTLRNKIQIPKFKEIRPHAKSRKTTLRVRFGSGKEIAEYYAADTFALTLKEIGLARVETLGLTEVGLPVVGTTKSAEYNQRRIDGKYICVHSNTNRKKETIERIAKRLGVQLKVEVIK